MPRVSVLLPVYNARGTLAVTLESVRRQTLTDWECLICDDGSTDGSLAIAREHAAQDSRFVLVERAHMGLVPTLNAGVRMCRAPYVARLDADDLCHRERLELQCGHLEQHPEFSGVGCGVRMFPRTGLSAKRREYETWLNSIISETDIIRDRFIECPLAHPTWFLRTDVLLALGYRDVGWPEDYDLLLRLMREGHRLSTMARRLLSWRDCTTRLSRVNPAYDIESFTRCRAYFLASDWLGGHAQYGLWGYGGTGKKLARALALYGKQPAFIVELHPRRIGQTILGARVIAPSAVSQQRQLGDRIIVSVAGLEERTEARRLATSQGLVEGRDFVCAA